MHGELGRRDRTRCPASSGALRVRSEVHIASERAGRKVAFEADSDQEKWCGALRSVPMVHPVLALTHRNHSHRTPDSLSAESKGTPSQRRRARSPWIAEETRLSVEVYTGDQQ